MAKIIKTGKEARMCIKKGIDLSVDCIKTTLGPNGRNAILGRQSMTPQITNDGVTIAQQIQSEDEIEELGVQLVKEVSRLTEISAGDGTTTASVLFQAIVDMGLTKIDDDQSLLKRVNAVKLKAEIDEACACIVSELEKSAKSISTKKEIKKVAKISVENERLAEIIAEIFSQIGKDGIITVEEGAFETEYSVVAGMEIGSGLLSPHFEEVTLKNPKILVHDGIVNNIEVLIPTIEAISKEGGKDLVVFARDFSKEIIDILVKNKITGIFNVIPVKATNVEGYQEKDLSALLGSSYGTCEKFVQDKDKTLFIGGKKPQNRIEELEKEKTKVTSEYDKNRLQKRISALSGGVAVIKVGAPSQSEREYWKAKLDDAVLATKYAMQEGVVAGGGVALNEVAKKLPKNILTECIKAPYNQIQENAGGSLEIGKDVIDPLKVTKSALINACSVAGMVLTTEIAVTNKHERPTETKTGSIDA